MTHKQKWNAIGNLGLWGALKKQKKDDNNENYTSNDHNKENVSWKQSWRVGMFPVTILW
jgi:hypothetical protein